MLGIDLNSGIATLYSDVVSRMGSGAGTHESVDSSHTYLPPSSGYGTGGIHRLSAASHVHEGYGCGGLGMVMGMEWVCSSPLTSLTFVMMVSSASGWVMIRKEVRYSWSEEMSVVLLGGYSWSG